MGWSSAHLRYKEVCFSFLLFFFFFSFLINPIFSFLENQNSSIYATRSVVIFKFIGSKIKFYGNSSCIEYGSKNWDGSFFFFFFLFLFSFSFSFLSFLWIYILLLTIYHFFNSSQDKERACFSKLSMKKVPPSPFPLSPPPPLFIYLLPQTEERKKREGERESSGQSISNTVAGFGERADVFSFGLLMLRVLTREAEMPQLASHEQLLQLCAGLCGF